MSSPKEPVAPSSITSPENLESTSRHTDSSTLDTLTETARTLGTGTSTPHRQYISPYASTSAEDINEVVRCRPTIINPIVTNSLPAQSVSHNPRPPHNLPLPLPPGGSGLYNSSHALHNPSLMQLFNRTNPGLLKHTAWECIKIHTAKCDFCHEHTKTAVQRCSICSKQVCLKCVPRIVSDGQHVLSVVDHDWNAYKGKTQAVKRRMEDSDDEKKHNPAEKTTASWKRKVTSSDAAAAHEIVDMISISDSGDFQPSPTKRLASSKKTTRKHAGDTDIDS